MQVIKIFLLNSRQKHSSENPQNLRNPQNSQTSHENLSRAQILSIEQINIHPILNTGESE